jgi:hypothetical protein
MCGGISLMDLFMATAGMATIYTIATFGPKLSLQNNLPVITLNYWLPKAMKTKKKELILPYTMNSYLLTMNQFQHLEMLVCLLQTNSISVISMYFYLLPFFIISSIFLS